MKLACFLLLKRKVNIGLLIAFSPVSLGKPTFAFSPPDRSCDRPHLSSTQSVNGQVCKKNWWANQPQGGVAVGGA